LKDNLSKGFSDFSVYYSTGLFKAHDHLKSYYRIPFESKEIYLTSTRRQKVADKLQLAQRLQASPKLQAIAQLAGKKIAIAVDIHT
jgi:murein DD-endopeptidase MepM/ murein hydrolase activator NlpD